MRLRRMWSPDLDAGYDLQGLAVVVELWPEVGDGMTG
jgi:hypothetical protein